MTNLPVRRQVKLNSNRRDVVSKPDSTEMIGGWSPGVADDYRVGDCRADLCYSGHRQSLYGLSMVRRSGPSKGIRHHVAHSYRPVHHRRPNNGRTDISIYVADVTLAIRRPQTDGSTQSVGGVPTDG